MRLEEKIKDVLNNPSSVSKRAVLAATLTKMRYPNAQEVWFRAIQIASSIGDFFNALALVRLNLKEEFIPEQLKQLSFIFSQEQHPEKLPSLNFKSFPEIKNFPTTPKDLADLAFQVGTASIGIRQPRELNLPPLPIFGTLSPEKFVSLAQHIEPIPLKNGQYLMKQDDTEQAFYLLSHGKVNVMQHRANQKDLLLATVSSPTVIGEMALLMSTPRRASVIANGSILTWRISSELLRNLTQKHPELINQIRHIIEQRQLRNLMRASDLFQTVKEKERLLKGFSLRIVEADTEIIKQGTPPPGLFVILHGEAIVFNHTHDRRVRVADLNEGDTFGEFSLLTGQPTSASVWMPNGGILLYMPTKSFQELRKLMTVRKMELRDLLIPSDTHNKKMDVSWLQSGEFKL